MPSQDDYEIGRTTHFSWSAESGITTINNCDWIKKRGMAFLERAYDLYKNDMFRLGDLPRLPVRVTVRPSASCTGGISGAASGGSLTYCAGEWNSNAYCYGILAHELCNLFTGECISEGWPTEWWANHRSPFPTMAANEVINRTASSYYRMWGNYSDPLVLMFDEMQREHKQMFQKMFQKMRELAVRLGGLSDPLLSHTIYYFMFYAAGGDIGRLFIVPPMPAIDLRQIKELETKYGLGVI